MAGAQPTATLLPVNGFFLSTYDRLWLFCIRVRGGYQVSMNL